MIRVAMGEKNGVDLPILKPGLLKPPAQTAPAKTEIDQDAGVFRGNAGAITAASTPKDSYFHGGVECISSV